MARYVKSYSKYIRRKRHQSIDGGVILERDWVTLGETLRFGKGKTPYYTDGNFIFTTSSVKNYPKRHKLDSDVSEFTYDDVEDASDTVNAVNPTVSTNDLRTFAYYGSCVELIRSTVEGIIAEFPGAMILSTDQLEYYDDDIDEFKTLSGYIVNNPFNIDLNHDNVVLGDYDNPYRFMSYSFLDYEVVIDGTTYEVTGYSIGEWEGDKDCPQNDQWNVKKAPVIMVTFTLSSGTLVLKGYMVNDDLIYLYEGSAESLMIKPKQEVIDEYFNTIEGFEKLLLNTDTIPLYTNTFVTPEMGELNYKFVNKTYTWPSNDYCIDINSVGYSTFISDLYNLGSTLDELWSDNLYSRMTHEAIKNFDWTYTREYMDGEEQDNIDGGERMKKILHIFGRVMDDIKWYIDSIKSSSQNSYAGYNDMPDAEVSDKLELTGWDITSTIPSFENLPDVSDIVLNRDSIDGYVSGKNYDNIWNDTDYQHEKWYNAVNANVITFADVDIELMKRLLLSSNRIWNSKGTTHSIEMVMGFFGFGKDEDYTITEKYYTAVPKPSDSYKDTIENINSTKTISVSSDIDFGGLPLSEIKVGDDKYIIPYFDQEKGEKYEYDGELYFQSKGGWGKSIAAGESEYDLPDAGDTTKDFYSPLYHKETLSYLHILSSVGDLLSVNPRAVESGDVYYVASLNDFMAYYESVSGTTEIDPEYVTHYFVFREGAYDPSVYSSWKNVSLTEGKNEWDVDDYNKVMYLDGIISTAFGNNPHCGYGVYDLGVEYMQYMETPFKYAIDNFLFETYDDLQAAKGITYSLTSHYEDKIQRLIEYQSDGITKDENATNNLFKNQVILNSKVLIIENLIDNDLYKEYFCSVILPYLMQVIPSTTILVLKNFEI